MLDLQYISNVSSLQDCIDACALYTWQANAPTYMYQRCTGAIWGNGRGVEIESGLMDLCVLKTNITEDIVYYFNSSDYYPGYDAAVLLFV